MKVKSLSRVRPSATPWTAAYQAPLSVGFSRQEYWSGMPLPSPQKVANATNKNYFPSAEAAKHWPLATVLEHGQSEGQVCRAHLYLLIGPGGASAVPQMMTDSLSGGMSGRTFG